MTQKAGTPPDGGALRLLVGIPLGALIALAVASMIGWLILGLPVAAYDPLKMPQFVWYYRGDRQVVRAMAGGLIGGGLLLGHNRSPSPEIRHRSFWSGQRHRPAS